MELYGRKNKSLNDDYYYGINGKGDGRDRGKRVYYFDGEKEDPSDISNTGKEAYKMRIDRGTGGYDINILCSQERKAL